MATIISTCLCLLMIGTILINNAACTVSDRQCRMTPWHYKGTPYLLANCSGLQLTSVPVFENTDIEAIDLSNNDINGRIDEGSFNHMKKLLYLDLSHNKHLTFRVLSNLTADLRATNITVLKLNKIHCASGIGTMVYDEDLKFFNSTNIEELHLDQNRLQMFGSNVPSYLPDSLKFLSIKLNILSAGPYLLQTINIKGLTTIDLSERLRFNNVQMDISELCHDWRGSPPQADQKSVWQQEKTLDFTVPFPKNLKQVYLNDLDLSFSFSKLRFKENVSLEKLHMQRNAFYSLDKPKSILKSLVYLDFSYNRCAKIMEGAFLTTPSLKTLNLSNNFLSLELKSDTNGRIFGPLNYLEHLDISSNRIETLPKQIFKGLDRLLFLNLSFNILSKVDFQIDTMKNLRVLDLSYNSISSLSNEFTNLIDDTLNHRKFALHLYGNPFQCTCATVDSLKWMMAKQLFIKDLNEYTCQYKSYKRYQFTKLQQVISELKETCTSFSGVIAGVLSSVVLVVGIILVALGYRYRWWIRYRYLTVRNKCRGYSPVENEDNTPYKYDAFVSYAHGDNDFIIKDLQPNLEDTHQKKLCLHQRDFIPGQAIADNIISAIHKSRTTVVILSTKSMESHWCTFELQMALMKKKPILIILIEDINERDVPSNFPLPRKSETYIQYPKEKEAQEEFWINVSRRI